MRLDPGCLTHAIVRSCEIKAAAVEADPLDLTGLRAILNYGHTVGHALEAVTRSARTSTARRWRWDDGRGVDRREPGARGCGLRGPPAGPPGRSVCR